MNHITQRKYLEIQLKNLKDFMPFCSNYDLPKLMNEIIKIHSRIETIRGYNVNKLVQKVEFFYETKQSKLNFKTVLSDD